MKKGLILGMFSASLMLASCGGIGGGTTTQGNQGNGSMLGSGVGESVGNIISSIIGGGKLSKENLYGTWRYDGPGCAFTSENLLARAGVGLAAAKAWNGTYTYNPTDASLQLKGLLINLNGYVVRNGLSGISVLFESKKVLTLFQTMAAVSGNSTAQVVGDISKNYDGVRVGFDLKK